MKRTNEASTRASFLQISATSRPGPRVRRSRALGSRQSFHLLVLGALAVSASAAAPTLQSQPQLQSTHAVPSTSSGGQVRAAAGSVLWDQPPSGFREVPHQVFGSRFPEFDIFMTTTVLFEQASNVTSVSTWFNDQGGAWAGNVTQAVLNIIPAVPPRTGDNPTAGMIVAVSATLDGGYTKIEAAGLDIDLLEGMYSVGLTPIADFDTIGQAFHVEAMPATSTAFPNTFARNPGGAVFQGTDWFPAGNLFVPSNSITVSLRIGGSPSGLNTCSTGSDVRLIQPPSTTSTLWSDSGCQDCTTGVTVRADNFELDAPTQITEAVVWGSYTPTGIPVAQDIFTLRVYADNAGAPGSLVFSESNVSSQRIATGQWYFRDIYKHTLTPTVPILLGPGTWWLEVANDTSVSSTDQWGWLRSNQDLVPGMVFAHEEPPSSWSTTSFSVAFQLCARTMDAAPGTRYCLSGANSTGEAATLSATGSNSIADGDLVITADGIPNSPGLFFYGPNQVQVPFQNNGFRCVGGAIKRMQPVHASGNSVSSQLLPGGDFTAPSTVNFQYWFRDGMVGPDGSNTSDGYSISFLD